MADPEAAGDKNKLAEEKHGEHKKRAEPTDHPTVRAVPGVLHGLYGRGVASGPAGTAGTATAARAPMADGSCLAALGEGSPLGSRW